MLTEADIRAARILVVDDLEANVLLLDSMLRGAGYSAVTTTMDPQSVCAMHREHRYDLILLDLQMPRMDGFQVMSGLRELEPEGYIPVIVLTAQPAHKLRALAVGARDFVGKPFDMGEVLLRVHNMLEVRLLHKELVAYGEKLAVRNDFICKTFGRYLSEEVMHRILDTGAIALDGETRTVTMMMADLRGFTSMAETVPAEKVAAIVNNFLGKMVDVIAEHGGTIDAFTGDGVFGLFGAHVEAPDDPIRAVSCALAMQLAMPEVNARNRELGLPEVEMGIGLHTGEVVVGSIGSATRAKFGVIGSAVNLTARVESFTTGGQIMLSQAMLDAVRDAVVSDEQLRVEPKGVSQAIFIHSVVGIRGRPELSLPTVESRLSTLAVPVEVQYSLLVGKGVSREVNGGTLTRLSRHHAEITADRTPPPFADLKLALVVDGEDLPGDIYAKVRGGAAPSGTFLVRFTAIASALEPRLAELLTNVVDR